MCIVSQIIMSLLRSWILDTIFIPIKIPLLRSWMHIKTLWKLKSLLPIAKHRYSGPMFVRMTSFSSKASLLLLFLFLLLALK